MAELLLAAYIGGIIASLPTAFGVRSSWWLFLTFSLGWPVVVLGTMFGVIQHEGTVDVDWED